MARAGQTIWIVPFCAICKLPILTRESMGWLPDGAHVHRWPCMVKEQR